MAASLFLTGIAHPTGRKGNAADSDLKVVEDLKYPESRADAKFRGRVAALDSLGLAGARGSSSRRNGQGQDGEDRLELHFG